LENFSELKNKKVSKKDKLYIEKDYKT
jgi:hypothetical protein